MERLNCPEDDRDRENVREHDRELGYTELNEARTSTRRHVNPSAIRHKKSQLADPFDTARPARRCRGAAGAFHNERRRPAWIDGLTRP